MPDRRAETMLLNSETPVFVISLDTPVLRLLDHSTQVLRLLDERQPQALQATYRHAKVARLPCQRVHALLVLRQQRCGDLALTARQSGDANRQQMPVPASSLLAFRLTCAAASSFYRCPAAGLGSWMLGVLMMPQFDRPLAFCAVALFTGFCASFGCSTQVTVRVKSLDILTLNWSHRSHKKGVALRKRPQSQ